MTTKKLTREEVLHIANLCNLNLTEEEIEKLSSQLSETVDFIEILNEIDTDNVEETFQVTGITNIFQKEDEDSTTLSQEESLKNASEEIKNLFATKAIFER